MTVFVTVGILTGQPLEYDLGLAVMVERQARVVEFLVDARDPPLRPSQVVEQVSVVGGFLKESLVKRQRAQQPARPAACDFHNS